MREFLTFLIPPLLGIVFYSLVAGFTHRNRKAILIGASIISIAMLGFYLYSLIVPNEGFRSLGWFVMSLLVGSGLAGYVIAWIIDSLFIKK